MFSGDESSAQEGSPQKFVALDARREEFESVMPAFWLETAHRCEGSRWGIGAQAS